MVNSTYKYNFLDKKEGSVLDKKMDNFSEKSEGRGDELSRFISRARRKLSHADETPAKKSQNDNLQHAKRIQYEFVSLNRNADYIKLSKAIDELLLNHPNCTDPILRLVNHSVYDNLNDSSKQKYILNLSSLYNQILKTKQKI